MHVIPGIRLNERGTASGRQLLHDACKANRVFYLTDHNITKEIVSLPNQNEFGDAASLSEILVAASYQPGVVVDEGYFVTMDEPITPTP